MFSNGLELPVPTFFLVIVWLLRFRIRSFSGKLADEKHEKQLISKLLPLLGGPTAAGTTLRSKGVTCFFSSCPLRTVQARAHVIGWQAQQRVQISTPNMIHARLAGRKAPQELPPYFSECLGSVIIHDHPIERVVSDSNHIFTPIHYHQGYHPVPLIHWMVIQVSATVAAP
jgi:hypothetical protein